MVEFVKEADLPVTLSLYIRNQAVKGWFLGVMHSGIDYYVPLSHGLKNLFKIRIRDGNPEFQDYNMECRASDILSNIVGSVYLQIRDTVGHGIEQSLHRELSAGVSKMFEAVIETRVKHAFEHLDNKLPNTKLCPDFKAGAPCPQEVAGDFYCGGVACEMINGKRAR